MPWDLFFWSKPVLKDCDIGKHPMALDKLLIQHLMNLQIASILLQFGKIGGWSPQTTLLIVTVSYFIESCWYFQLDNFIFCTKTL